MSAEPGRKKGYSSDIGWRIVYQRMALDYSFKDVATALNIAPSTAHRIYTRFVATGDVKPQKSTPKPEMRALDEHKELLLLSIVLQNPSVYLYELCQKVFQLTTIKVSPSTVCRVMKRYGMTRRKIRQVALQRNCVLRGAFVAYCSALGKHQFVWVDETGCDKRDHIRKYGYSFRGIPPVSQRLLVRGERVNAILALSMKGVIAFSTMTGPVNGSVFYDFVRGTLIPNMQVYDGENPNSIVIMDNCSVHHVQEVEDVIQQSGILPLFLPPYSPDLNPVEEAFSYIKGYMRKHDDLLQCGIKINDVLTAAITSISVKQCLSWITDSGYL